MGALPPPTRPHGPRSLRLPHRGIVPLSRGDLHPRPVDRAVDAADPCAVARVGDAVRGDRGAGRGWHAAAGSGACGAAGGGGRAGVADAVRVRVVVPADAGGECLRQLSRGPTADRRRTRGDIGEGAASGAAIALGAVDDGPDGSGDAAACETATPSPGGSPRAGSGSLHPVSGAAGQIALSLLDMADEGAARAYGTAVGAGSGHKKIAALTVPGAARHFRCGFATYLDHPK